MNSDHSPIGDISSLLTPEQVVKFIRKAVPDLKLSKSTILLALEKQQWKVAAKQAHSLKSTISLFSSDNLVISLDLIESSNFQIIKSPEFKKSLITQYQDLIDNLENYLADN